MDFQRSIGGPEEVQGPPFGVGLYFGVLCCVYSSISLHFVWPRKTQSGPRQKCGQVKINENGHIQKKTCLDSQPM